MNNKIIIILLCWREKKAECWKFAFESVKVDIIFFIIKQKLYGSIASIYFNYETE